MYPRLFSVQLVMMLLASTSSILLGRSLGDPQIIWISLAGAISAFVVVDRLKWAELSGWLANLVSLLVLFYTMQDFVGGGSVTKLVAVANLLAYLLTVLLFQKKTPRLCWQIMVLSVLQVVVASIFNLNFEDGWLFIGYFAIATMAMMLQNDFQQWSRIQQVNRDGRDQLSRWANAHAADDSAASPSAIILSPLPAGVPSAARRWMLIPWIASSLLFAFILFHSLPHTQQDLQSPTTHRFSGTGQSWRADLDEQGVVPQSTALQFRARFFDLRNDDQIVLNSTPYFRGMAMSKLVLNNGKTSWVAPYDHVFDFSSYQRPSGFPVSLAAGVRPIGLEIIMEPTNDPLLFATMPAYRHEGAEFTPEFCRDLSALTRRRSKFTNVLTSFHYQLTTIVDQVNRPLPGWPYRSFFSRNATGHAMLVDSPEHRMLTEMDSSRYPELVRVARQIRDQSPGVSRQQLCRRLVDHFSRSNGYNYTIDYRDLDRDETLDPVEDFVCNHRTGHCAMYASALTLMLRSLGIPARYVVGFHGSEYNQLTDCYVVRGRQAHAWVEAYLPPDECSDDLRNRGVAGPGGAWLTLDPTPAIPAESSNEAIDLARSIWQDYVISPDHNKQQYHGGGPLQKASLADSQTRQMLDHFVEFVRSSRMFQISLVGGVLLLILFSMWRAHSPDKPTASGSRGPHPVRRWAGRMVGVFSRDLGLRVAGRNGSVPAIAFYQRMERMLHKNWNLQRKPGQTQREFAQQAKAVIASGGCEHSLDASLGEMLTKVTDAFYQARFASTPLDSQVVARLENQIRNLEQKLNNSHS